MMPCQCRTDEQRQKCMWWIDKAAGILETQPTTGEVRFVTGCFPEVMFRLFEFVVKTNVSAASAIEGHRNAVFDGVSQLTTLLSSLSSIPSMLVQLESSMSTCDQIDTCSLDCKDLEKP